MGGPVWQGWRRLAVCASLLSIAACASSTGADTTSTSDAVEVTNTTETPATTSTTESPTTTTTSPGTAVPDVSERQFGFVEPFTITIPPQWERDSDSTQQNLYVLVPPDNLLYFAVGDRATVDEWQEYLTSNTGLEVTEPAPVEIGGASGFTSDLSLGAEATADGCMSPDPCVTLVGGQAGWVIVPGLNNRVWVVDVGGRPVFIAAESTPGSFASFTADVEEALATLTWAEG